MSYFLTNQASQFLSAIFAGMILSCIYDVFRIFRNVIKHNSIWVNVEDFFYWNFVGIFLYVLIFYSNDGILRWFIIASAILGAFLYNIGIGRFMVKYLSVLINFIINNLLKKPVKRATILFVKVLKIPTKFIKHKLSVRLERRKAVKIKRLEAKNEKLKAKGKLPKNKKSEDKLSKKGEVNGKKSKKKSKIK